MVKLCEICGKEFRLPIGGKICKYCRSHCPKCGKKMGIFENDRARSRKYFCDQCFEKEQQRILKEEKLVVKNPELGFTPQYLSELKEQLKIVEKKTCLDCVLCQLQEKTVEKASVTNLLGALAGAPIEYEIRVNLVCRKFLLDLNDKLESASECSSFLTEKEYHEKAIKGEIVGFAGVTKNESIPIQKPVMANCDYCQAQYNISLYRKCPRCGAYSPKISKEIL